MVFRCCKMEQRALHWSLCASLQLLKGKAVGQEINCCCWVRRVGCPRYGGSTHGRVLKNPTEISEEPCKTEDRIQLLAWEQQQQIHKSKWNQSNANMHLYLKIIYPPPLYN